MMHSSWLRIVHHCMLLTSALRWSLPAVSLSHSEAYLECNFAICRMPFLHHPQVIRITGNWREGTDVKLRALFIPKVETLDCNDVNLNKWWDENSRLLEWNATFHRIYLRRINPLHYGTTSGLPVTSVLYLLFSNQLRRLPLKEFDQSYVANCFDANVNCVSLRVEINLQATFCA